MTPWLEGIFWGSAAVVVLVTAGYPAFLALSGPFVRRARPQNGEEPTVSLIIAAFNEEAVIAGKIENSLGLDYPRARLQIMVASDGSTDGTDAIARSFADRGVLLRRLPRSGKTGLQNQAVESATGEILVFSDANAMYRPDALRKLVRNFADPEVGCVCGQLVYQARGASAGECERSYWDYEKFMKRRESDLSSLIGANGSIYAVRRSDYVPIAPDLISDLVEPLALVRMGRRVVYEPEAVSVEEASPTYGVEFRRKVRILTRSIRGLLHMRELLNPLRYGVFSFQLLMHKLLRYLTPLFLVTGFASLVGLAAAGRYRGLLATALAVVAAAALAGRLASVPRAGRVLRPLLLLYYYLMVNAALLLAWGKILRGAHMTLWAPEGRVSR